ncbi:MAG: hypothetical protein AB7L91_07780 [Dehalococcoidia bacterium]
MRAQELRELVTSPTRLVPFQDEVAWGELVDRLIASVREDERARSAATLAGLATSVLAVSSVEAASRLIAGVAARDYAPLAPRTIATAWACESPD